MFLQHWQRIEPGLAGPQRKKEGWVRPPHLPQKKNKKKVGKIWKFQKVFLSLYQVGNVTDFKHHHHYGKIERG